MRIVTGRSVWASPVDSWLCLHKCVCVRVLQSKTFRYSVASKGRVYGQRECEVQLGRMRHPLDPDRGPVGVDGGRFRVLVGT